MDSGQDWDEEHGKVADSLTCSSEYDRHKSIDSCRQRQRRERRQALLGLLGCAAAGGGLLFSAGWLSNAAIFTSTGVSPVVWWMIIICAVAMLAPCAVATFQLLCYLPVVYGLRLTQCCCQCFGGSCDAEHPSDFHSCRLDHSQYYCASGSHQQCPFDPAESAAPLVDRSSAGAPTYSSTPTPLDSRRTDGSHPLEFASACSSFSSPVAADSVPIVPPGMYSGAGTVVGRTFRVGVEVLTASRLHVHVQSYARYTLWNISYAVREPSAASSTLSCSPVARGRDALRGAPGREIIVGDELAEGLRGTVVECIAIRVDPAVPRLLLAVTVRVASFTPPMVVNVTCTPSCVAWSRADILATVPSSSAPLFESGAQ